MTDKTLTMTDAEVIDHLRYQLAECQEQKDELNQECRRMEIRIVECQAREKVLRDALADGISGATKEDIKQAKRDALLEFADLLDAKRIRWVYPLEIRQRAKELE